MDSIQAWDFTVSEGKKPVSHIKIKATKALALRLAENFAENDILRRNADAADRWNHRFSQYRDQQYSIVSFPEGDVCYRLIPAED